MRKLGYKVFQRCRLAYRKTVTSSSLSTNLLQTFLFFLLAERQRVARFHLKNKLAFFARPADWVGVEEIALEGEYNFIAPFLAHNSMPVVLDLGANIGMFSMLVFSLCPTAIIHAVEPGDKTYEVLEYNRQANPGLSWHTYRAAIWDEAGKINFADNATASTASYVSPDGGNKQIPTGRLSDLINKIGSNIDLLKMDIEGAEERVLYQSQHLLNKIDTLIVEIHPYRCNQARVVHLLKESFDYLYQVGRQSSAKPLLIASRTRWNLPDYLLSD